MWLPDELKDFYVCFEASNTEACMRAPAVPYNSVITISLAEVRKTFNRSTFAGPDGLPGHAHSSEFNTIVPSKLITELRTLGLNTSLCNWILDFLTGCPLLSPLLDHYCFHYI